MGKSKYALVTGRQALTCVCHIVVDEIITTVRPKLPLRIQSVFNCQFTALSMVCVDSRIERFRK